MHLRVCVFEGLEADLVYVSFVGALWCALMCASVTVSCRHARVVRFLFVVGRRCRYGILVDGRNSLM